MKSEYGKKLIRVLLLTYFITTLNLTFLFIDCNTKYQISAYCEPDYNLNSLRSSTTSDIIHLNNNWTMAKSVGICTGNGTYDDPYLIKDLEITTFPESGILIENSDVYFSIENCTIGHAAEPNAGIYLVNVSNAYLVNNDCSQNYYGIRLVNCTNNTISGNLASDSEYFGYTLRTGISLVNSHQNRILSNIANYSGHYGILMYQSSNNILSGNIACCQESGDGILLSNCNNNIISDNIVNSNGITSLTLFNVRTAEGIELVYSNNNVISYNTAKSNSRSGILLYSSRNNKIIGNTFSNNYYGVYLKEKSNNNMILDNALSDNSHCIKEEECVGNVYWNNGFCIYIGAPFLHIILFGAIISVIVFVCIFLNTKKRKEIDFPVNYNPK